jgi:hypothetical protein
MLCQFYRILIKEGDGFMKFRIRIRMPCKENIKSVNLIAWTILLQAKKIKYDPPVKGTYHIGAIHENWNFDKDIFGLFFREAVFEEYSC